MQPTGSGWYAAIVGLFLIGGIAGTFLIGTDRQIHFWLFRFWLLFAGASLMYWGINRVRTGTKDYTIGQDTINMVNGVIASTIALLALMFGK